MSSIGALSRGSSAVSRAHETSRWAVLMFVLTLIVSISWTCRADTIAYTFSGSGSQSGQDGTYGFQFTPLVNIEVTSLGFLDAGQDGLSAGHEVGIWNSQGTLVASSTVTTANSALAGAVVDGAQFRFASIAPVLLTAGTTYTLGAFENSSGDMWFAPITNISNAPSLVAIGNYGIYAPFNAEPIYSGPREYAIGNFGFEPVPEPGTIVLFGTGVVGLAARLRRQLRRG